MIKQVIKMTLKFRSCFTISCMAMILSFAGCKKDSASCHYTLKIQNRSASAVNYVTIGSYDSKCFITTKGIIRPTEIFEDERKDCLEVILEEEGFEFQLQEVSDKRVGTSVLCDSSSLNNRVLEKYKLTENDLPRLQTDNFLIVFTHL